ncbi:hypothetical protein CIK81_07425 [Brachybacterium sp. JB7]|nr:hypothetical protein CIK81_07425 [Brachybacterium sp. JB7]RCS79656.1 hypothetical protein CIK72_09555 [Brachybacterium alimentarium]
MGSFLIDVEISSQSDLLLVDLLHMVIVRCCPRPSAPRRLAAEDDPGCWVRCRDLLTRTAPAQDRSPPAGAGLSDRR